MVPQIFTSHQCHMQYHRGFQNKRSPEQAAAGNSEGQSKQHSGKEEQKSRSWLCHFLH